MDRKLHIGGKLRVDGWEVINALPADYVDHLGNAADLSRFEDKSFSKLYASHVLEHFDYKEELLAVLKEWHRVLKHNGELYISVPNLDVLARMFVDDNYFNVTERYQIMRMMFGGHIDQYDYHYVGLNYDFLKIFMREAGFSSMRQVRNFDIFDDTSSYMFKGTMISLNVIAYKL